MKTKKVKISSLKPHPKNHNTHPASQIVELQDSLKQFDQVRNIITWQGYIIAGHGIVTAAQKQGIEYLKAVDVSDWPEEKAIKLMAADNRLSELAVIDDNLLSDLLKTMADPLDIPGFNGNEIERLLGIDTGLTGPDETPDIPLKAMTELGDIWRMGGAHQLICGDCREAPVLSKLMHDHGKAAMVFTDPPYNADYRALMKDRLRDKKRKILNDNFKTNKEFYSFLCTAIKAFKPHVSGDVYICMGTSELHTLQKAFIDCGGHWSTFIIWVKNTFVMGRNNYQSQYETILYGWFLKSTHYWSGARNLGNVIGLEKIQYDLDGTPLCRIEPGGIETDIWPFPRPDKNKEHPTMKPVALCARAIKNSSKRNDIVLDGFGGSGSTLIACEQTKRKCRIAELSPKYCDVILKRWADYTGKDPIREDGVNFSELSKKNEKKNDNKK